jgi:hypothetical protein
MQMRDDAACIPPSAMSGAVHPCVLVLILRSIAMGGQCVNCGGCDDRGGRERLVWSESDLFVIYEVLPHEIVVKVIGYDEAKAASAGHG